MVCASRISPHDNLRARRGPTITRRVPDLDLTTRSHQHDARECRAHENKLTSAT